MITVEKDFHTWMDAHNYRKGYERSFPPSEYGTNLRIARGPMRQGWQVVGHRFISVDKSSPIAGKIW